MKKIYYLLVCLFSCNPLLLQGRNSHSMLFTEWAEHECGSLYGWDIPDSGYSSFNLF